jgi:nucleoside-diphosphate kinase
LHLIPNLPFFAKKEYMAGNLTFSMIKPDVVGVNKIADVLKMITDAGFQVVAMKMVKLNREQAEGFYAVHKGQPFYEGLVEFMTSGPSVAMILKKDNAVADLRKLIGNTDPAKAEEGTLRKKYATNNRRNAVHASDSDDNAKIEASYFFSRIESVNE